MDAPDDLNLEDVELVAEAEEERRYSFDRLLDNELLDNVVIPGYGLLDDDRIIFDEAEVVEDEDIYDEDLGLPEDDDQQFDDALPIFEYPQDDDELPLQDDNPGHEDGPDTYYAAFQEPALIRNAYIDILIQKTRYGSTHQALKHQLRAMHRALSNRPEICAEDFANMAQTIGTVERRLGVNINGMITTFTLCPTCNRRYTPDYIAEAVVNTCLNPGCDGVLFNVRRLASGSLRRVSNLTFPFASPIVWLQHLLSLAGTAELLQTWRTEENDRDGPLGPIASDLWMENIDMNKPLGDISDGWGWRSTEAGLSRFYDPNTGEVTDRRTIAEPIRFVSLPFGLSLSLNTDW
ncbi:hypothetical protein RSOLAG1IB_11840 [Rhizoctonia solani AG-1 IB]|jgi:hypothetical protein|uniref:Uncharacterized protein n=1 Tax=Thanatephorus cucumeris (strain AG1-IB / isolate 7/3/14) TaxID=1108050 RepID=A0A0B7FFQ8_THACB|nr:hypothetical protein RSOLAG1IB_11840 [Rhizoctonia solani AG-1 IB]